MVRMVDATTCYDRFCLHGGVEAGACLRKEVEKKLARMLKDHEELARLPLYCCEPRRP